MKKLGMILSLVIVFGLFITVSSVSAAVNVENLQPASTITYNEDLIVNATGSFNSIRVGKQGTGGVTFFNGTIVNSTTGTGNSDNPVTIGDKLRVDDTIYRTEIGGNNPLKIGDTLKPQTTAVYDLGTTTNQFRNAYFSGTVTTAALSGTGIVNSANILDGTIATTDLADSAVTTAKIVDGTIATADLADGAVTFDKIDDSERGIAKAGGVISNIGGNLSFFSSFGGGVTVNKTDIGVYEVTISGAQQGDLAVCIATLLGTNMGEIHCVADEDGIIVNTASSTGVLTDESFNFVVY